MARRTARPVSICRFTPLAESRSGLQSRSGENGRRVYKGVTIIKAGLGNARDRNYYPPETLNRAVENGSFEGLRAYADHPDSVSEEIQPERTVRDMVGVYKGARYLNEGTHKGRVVADLHLFRSAKWLSDTVDDLIQLGQSDKIGLSINGRGKTVEKRLQLEESADPIDVNYVEDFMVLRSGDVVTEAGAGGGFQHLLESARGSRSRTKETAMLTAKQKNAIKEAVDAADYSALGKLLKECGCSLEQAVAIAKEGAPAAKGAKGRKTTEAGKKKAAAKPAEDATDVEEAEDEEDEPDPNAELDEAVDEVVNESEEDEDADEVEESDEDAEDVEESEDDEVEESDEDVEEAEEVPATRVSKGNGKHPLAGAADKIRRSAAAREAHGGNLHMPKGKKTTIKGTMDKPTNVNIIGGRRKQGGGQKGRKFGESDAPASAPELMRQNARLREDNARLVSQLRIRTTADRARKLLRESAIPEKLRPEILRLMVGKSENEMQRIMRYHERLVTTAIEEATYSDLGSGVEGAGARVRESFHGGSDRSEDFGSLFDEVGIPTRSDK